MSWEWEVGEEECGLECGFRSHVRRSSRSPWCSNLVRVKPYGRPTAEHVWKESTASPAHALEGNVTNKSSGTPC